MKLAHTLCDVVELGHTAYPDDEQMAQAARELRALLRAVRALRRVVRTAKRSGEWTLADGAAARALASLEKASRGRGENEGEREP